MTTDTRHEITLEIAEEALGYISSEDREVWRNIAFALHHHFSGSAAAYGVWERWSQSADSFDLARCRSTWRVIKHNSAHPITIATLIHYATESGWTPRYGRSLTKEEWKAKKDQERAAQRAAQKEVEEQRKKTAAFAKQLWQTSHPAAEDHPYLANKRLPPTPAIHELPISGVVAVLGYQPKCGGEPLVGRILLIPVKIGNALASIEMVDESGLKSALPGAGTRSGGYWATAKVDKDLGRDHLILLGEGVGTVFAAATAVHAIGVAALSNTNLPNVAAWLTKQAPDTQVIVLADKNRNGGWDQYASNTASKYHWELALPPLEGAESDFCDVWVRGGASPIRETIAQYISFTEAPAATDDDDSHAEQVVTNILNAVHFHGPKNGSFHLDPEQHGVFYLPSEADENARPMFICGPLEVAAHTKNAEGHEAGFLLRWVDKHGEERSWVASAGLLYDRSQELFSALANENLNLSTNKVAREYLLEYIRTYPATSTAITTSTVGWALRSRAYVMPNRTIGGDDGTVIVYTGDIGEGQRFSSAGTAEGWRDEVAARAAGNSRLVFSILVAFTGVVLRLVEEQGFGFHFYGQSSTGKSTAQRLCAGIWGHPDEFMRTWRATANGLEGIAGLSNDNTLVLDEIGQADPKEVGVAAYLLANGDRKLRASRSGVAYSSPNFRIAFLSSGEYPQSVIADQANVRTHAGQEIRMLDIPVDAEQGMGVLENLHGAPTAAATIVALNAAMRKHYGVVGPLLIEHIAKNWEQTIATLKASIAAYTNRLSQNESNNQISRAIKNISICGAVGDLITALGLTGWSAEEVPNAITKIFGAWFEGFGTIQREHAKIYEQVRSFFTAHGSARFENINTFEGGNIRIVNRAGFVRYDKDDGLATYYVLPDAFRNEVCKGYDIRTASKALLDAGWIVGNGAKSSQIQRLPGIGPTRCYVFTAQMWGEY